MIFHELIQKQSLDHFTFLNNKKAGRVFFLMCLLVLAGVVPPSFPRIVNSSNFSYGYLLTICHEWFN